MAIAGFLNIPVGNLLAATSAPGDSAHAWYIPWLVSTGIIALGLFVYGWKDLVRTHWRRVWAISSVCVTESLRRRVLWVTPLAILGVIVVSQFQHGLDAQDVIRQTTKFCLFTSSLLVTLTALILASTNLPREIENRVIYTIVTKPTTRLEIVLGKILGFARVSGLILLIMGVFTLGYLEVRARPMLQELRTKISALPVNDPTRATDEYYISSGLLGTRSLDLSDDVEIYARPPGKDERWVMGGVGNYGLVTFILTEDEKATIAQVIEKEVPVYFNLNLDVAFHTPDDKQSQDAKEMGLESQAHKTFNVPFPTTGPTTKASRADLIPQVGVRFLDENHQFLVPTNSRENAVSVRLKPGKPGEPYTGTIEMDFALLQKAIQVGRFEAQIIGATPATEFGFREHAATLVFPIKEIPPIQTAADKPDPVHPTVYFGSYPGRHGIRLTMVQPGADGPVAVFRFHDTPVSPGPDGKVGLQINPPVERTGDFVADSSHSSGYSTGTVEVRNLTTGESSGQITFTPETSRTQPVAVEGRYMAGGKFDVVLRNTTPGQNLGIEAGTVAVVAADRSFVFNLLKSLLILWLLSLMVVIIAIFCSTFVSWPIAVVLTLVLLLAHWGVNQLGSALAPGIAGRQAASAMGMSNSAGTAVVSQSVDKLSGMITFISPFLPDVAKFPVTENIERGESIPAKKVLGAMQVIFCYGFPMIVFSYVILRRKEVAP